MNTFKNLFGLLCLLALACGSSVGETEDTTDGEFPESDEPVELGSLEQALFRLPVSVGTGDDFMGAPRDEFELSGRQGFHRCTDGAPSSTSCRNKTLTVPTNHSFNITVSDAEQEARFDGACSAISAAGTGVSCNAVISGSCSGSLLCVANTATPSGLPGFDLRNYGAVRCNAVANTTSATWNGNSYTVQRCSDYRASYDVTAMKAKGTSSAQDQLIMDMVARFLVAQAAGEGLTTGGSSYCTRPNYSSVPASIPPAISPGGACRVSHQELSGSTLSWTNAAACANN